MPGRDNVLNSTALRRSTRSSLVWHRSQSREDKYLALRINLYGCKLRQLLGVIGSKDSSVREIAGNYLSETLTDEAALAKACAWLRTLVDDGYPLKSEREPPSVPDDGSLLVTRLETELHAFVVYSIVRAVSRNTCLDLASDSSHWHHSAIVSLYNDFRICGFTRSKECPTRFLQLGSALSHGTPLFGDDFRTDWSFYTFLTNNDLENLVSVLEAARKFEKPVPDYVPAEVRKTMVTRLSDEGNAFAEELIAWFCQIQQAHQDAFIMWW